MKMARQGDVLLVRSRNDPESEGWTETPGYTILARGEKSGHDHVLVGPRILTQQQYGHPEVCESIWIPEGARLLHADHSPIDLPPGSYDVRRQRQYVNDDEETEVED